MPSTAASCPTGPTVAATNESRAAAAQNWSTATITVQCPEISVLKTALDDSVSAGELASFKIVVSNAGPGAAQGVVINDTLPAGIAWIVDDTTHCGIAAGVLTCTFASIAAGDHVTVIVTGETSVDDCGTLTNTATVSAANDGPVGTRMPPRWRSILTAAPRPSRSIARTSSSPRRPTTSPRSPATPSPSPSKSRTPAPGPRST